MIETINIKGVASYDETGVEITDLNKVNFIYGANGSGKTTISNYLYTPSERKFLTCDHKWINSSELKILVYNKQFREDNFGDGKINGVFTLGKATKEEKELIDRKIEELKELKKEYIKRKETLDKKDKEREDKEEDFKELVWKSIYKKNERNFKEAFVGSLNKEKFKQKLLLELSSNNSDLLTFDELISTSKTIFGKQPILQDKIITIDFKRLVEIENSSIWNKKIIGRSDVDIARLIDRLNINDWVNQGKFIAKETEGVCPFCQQKTITPDFLEQLELYFDGEFKQNIERIKLLREDYLSEAKDIVNVLIEIESHQKNNRDSKLNIELFSAKLKTLISIFSENKELLHNKIKEPSRSIELKSVKIHLESICELISDANKMITKHNNLVYNYTTARETLIGNIWRFVLDENESVISPKVKEIEVLNKAISGINKGYRNGLQKWRELNAEIKELTKNVTSIQPSVDSINATLKFYGFNNFEIVPASEEENAYQIKRENGELATRTLSEGEVTFITFLYFLQLVKGATDKENISEDRVVVIDDPISSLDSNVLYVVSSLTKELIKKIKKDEGSVKQLILLTHNVFFHKEVSFLDGRKNNEEKKANFWILRKREKTTSIQSFEHDNPIHTSYELLWREIRNNDSIISIQNNMRRIIEHYFKVLGKYGDDKLINKFEVAEEREICRALLTWINDGSHSINDPLFVEYQDTTVDKYCKVFREIFVKTNQEAHYDMMMGVTEKQLN